MRAFTLFETLIYIALFSILVSGLIACYLQVQSSAEENHIEIVSKEEALFILAKISSFEDQGFIVQTGDTSSEILVLQNNTGDVVKFYSDEGDFILKKNTVAMPLNSNNIVVTDFKVSISEIYEYSFSIASTTYSARLYLP
ncbi:MAG: hypothetical protein JWN64_102 [Parcubacteria group bacterium]|nr:hypothetical protein [Parcubacteria group bacterium]